MHAMFWIQKYYFFKSCEFRESKSTEKKFDFYVKNVNEIFYKLAKINDENVTNLLAVLLIFQCAFCIALWSRSAKFEGFFFQNIKKFLENELSEITLFFVERQKCQVNKIVSIRKHRNIIGGM